MDWSVDHDAVGHVHEGDVMQHRRVERDKRLPVGLRQAAQMALRDLGEDATTRAVMRERASQVAHRYPDGEGADVAWTYVDPLHEVAQVKDHLCFYAERTDLSVDGVDVPRPRTFWSSPKDQETI